MIEASQRMIGEQNSNNNNPAIKEYFKLQIKTLQGAHRDEDKSERLLKEKERKKGEANDIEVRQRLVTELIC